MLGLGVDMIINSYLDVDYSQKLLFITSPTPRTEINEGDSINITTEAVGASSVAVYYRNTSDVWVSIGSATNTSGSTWTYSSWSPTVNATAIKATATYPDGTTQEVENIMYSLSMYDTFTDTNGTAIASHNPDSDLSGGWTVVTGDWEIQSNGLVNTTADTNLHVIYHDCGYDDFIFESTLANLDGGTTQQILARYTDSDNFVLLLVNGSGLPTLRERYLASNTDHYTGSNGDVSSTDVLKLILKGDKYIFFINNVTVSSGTLSGILTGGKCGFRRGGASSNTRFDDVKIIPITSNPLDASVSYTASKLGSAVITKGSDSPNDDGGIADNDIVTVGSTNYLIYAARDSGGNFDNISYYTSSTGDPHNWTFQNNILTFTTESVAGVSAWHDGTDWHLLYSDRLTGIIYYASGSNIESLTKNGSVKDLTGSGIYLRQSSIIKEDSTWYVFVDVRLDAASGEFGYLGLMEGSSLSTLGDPVEVLTGFGEDYDILDVTVPSVKKNGDYYEMFYAGYSGIGTSAFPHEIGLAISKNIKGKYKRVSNSPLVSLGVGTFDNIDLGAPVRMPNTDILYYRYDGSGTAGGLDGITYATLS
jgi:hypothetical protein